MSLTESPINPDPAAQLQDSLPCSPSSSEECKSAEASSGATQSIPMVVYDLLALNNDGEDSQAAVSQSWETSPTDPIRPENPGKDIKEPDMLKDASDWYRSSNTFDVTDYLAPKSTATRWLIHGECESASKDAIQKLIQEREDWQPVDIVLKKGADDVIVYRLGDTILRGKKHERFVILQLRHQIIGLRSRATAVIASEEGIVRPDRTVHRTPVLVIHLESAKLGTKNVALFSSDDTIQFMKDCLSWFILEPGASGVPKMQTKAPKSSVKTYTTAPKASPKPETRAWNELTATAALARIPRKRSLDQVEPPMDMFQHSKRRKLDERVETEWPRRSTAKAVRGAPNRPYIDVSDATSSESDSEGVEFVMELQQRRVQPIVLSSPPPQMLAQSRSSSIASNRYYVPDHSIPAQNLIAEQHQRLHHAKLMMLQELAWERERQAHRERVELLLKMQLPWQVWKGPF